MGLSWGVIDFSNRETLTVLPRRYSITRRFELPGGRHFQPGGVDSTWSIGESDEFVSLRDYREGDSMRKIHWSSSAKRNKPVVKEFQEEYLVRQALVLDSETENMPVLEETISLAATLLLHESEADSMLDLVYFSDHACVISSGHGGDTVNRQLEALASMSPAKESLESIAEAAARHAGELSGCIVVLTGWDEAREELVEKIRKTGVAIEVLIVTDRPEELDVPGRHRVLDARNMVEEVARL